MWGFRTQLLNIFKFSVKSGWLNKHLRGLSNKAEILRVPAAISQDCSKGSKCQKNWGKVMRDGNTFVTKQACSWPSAIWMILSAFSFHKSKRLLELICCKDLHQRKTTITSGTWSPSTGIKKMNNGTRSLFSWQGIPFTTATAVWGGFSWGWTDELCLEVCHLETPAAGLDHTNRCWWTRKQNLVNCILVWCHSCVVDLCFILLLPASFFCKSPSPGRQSSMLAGPYDR